MADGKLTLDDVRAIMYGTDDCDPIADGPEDVTDSGEEIVIAGYDTEGDGSGDYRDDIRMVQEGDGVRLYRRDPGDEAWEETGGLFTNLDDLHGWIYEL